MVSAGGRDPVEDDGLGVGIDGVTGYREPRDAVGGICGRAFASGTRRAVEINVAVRGELRIEGDPKQPTLAVGAQIDVENLRKIRISVEPLVV